MHFLSFHGIIKINIYVVKGLWKHIYHWIIYKRSQQYMMSSYTINPIRLGEDIILYGLANQFSLEQTLECGQAFRWSPIGTEKIGFSGIVMGKYLEISAREQDIILHNTTLEDYHGVWEKYFDLQTDYEKLKAQFSSNKIMSDAIGFAPGIRVLCQDPWETICTFIISANNNIPRITAIVERLCQLAGEEIAPQKYAFPTPAAMANLSLDDFAILRCG